MLKTRPQTTPTLRIGLTAAHGERVRPDQPGWSMLLELLGSLPAEHLTLTEPLHTAPLGALDAICVGAPTAPLPKQEVAALRRWVRRGGRLLWLGSPETDMAALRAIQPAATGPFDRLAAPAEPPLAEATMRLAADAAPLLGRAGTLCFDNGVQLRSRGFGPALDARGRGAVWPRGRGVLKLRRPETVLGALLAPAQIIRLAPDEEGGPDKLRTHRASGALLLLHTRQGRGEVLAVGAADSFRDRVLSEADNLDVLLAILHAWLPAVFPREVARRRREPQRHRLLQGYPMAPLMPPAASTPTVPDADRPLLVGVLPHPFCNPAVQGCGFCTFPHQDFRRDDADETARATLAELRAALAAHPGLGRRPVEAIYFGGGTANLTPPEPFAALCAALAEGFRTDGAEVTLEGVPRYFLLHDRQLLRALAAHLPDARPRISMGVQTFDPARLAEMGRQHFGTQADIAEVIAAARDLGASVSGDLLFNLPGQSLDEMRADLDTAIGLGFDQICLYHLVLFEGLGTAWSTDPARLAALPANTEAAARWRALRQALLDAGFVQTTLTNFERPAGFRYEVASFQPDRFDAIGFGPGALATMTDGGAAVKWRSAADAATYRARVAARGWAPEHAFAYDGWDLRLLHLTRQLARLRIDTAGYRERFGTAAWDDFGAPLGALKEAGLIAHDEQAIWPTPEGMFFADTIAGVLAWPRATAHRARQVLSGQGRAAATRLDLRHYERAVRHGMG